MARSRLPEVDADAVAKALTEVSRVEVAEATFEFCAVRLDFFRRNNRGETIPSEITDGLRSTYDRLSEALSPASSDELHELIQRYESAFTP